MATHIDHAKFPLTQAISNYSYPAAYHDFATGTDTTHVGRMAGLEQMFLDQLRSGNPTVVREALANVIHWAFARNSRERTRFRRRFFRHATAAQINDFIQLVDDGRTPDLQQLFALKFPIYSGIATASKVLMFLDPDAHTTFDSKIAQIQYQPTNPNRSIVRLSIGQLKNTAANRQAYVDWCTWCVGVNSNWFRNKYRAADIERGMFQLVSDDNISLARDIYRGVP